MYFLGYLRCIRYFVVVFVWKIRAKDDLDVQLSPSQRRALNGTFPFHYREKKVYFLDRAGGSSKEQSVCDVTIDDVSRHVRSHTEDSFPFDGSTFRFRDTASVGEEGEENDGDESASAAEDNFFDDFQDLNSILNFLKTIDANFDSVSLIPSVGKSVEGRDIPALRICMDSCEQLPKVYIQGLLHAREWIGAAATLYVAYHLAQVVEGVVEDPNSKDMLSSVEIVAIPVVNLDGYVYSWESDRLWRKNRRKHPDGTYGVDLNRNFAVPMSWGQNTSSPNMGDDGQQTIGTTEGMSTSPAEETFRGESSFSEPETVAVRDFVLGLGPPNLRLLGVDFHSYGQTVLRGYGYQRPEDGLPEDEHIQKRMGDAAASAMSQRNGATYESRHAGEGNFVGAGGCDDWLHDVAEMRSFTVELRDDGKHGFLLPKEQIKPTGEEALAGLLAMWGNLKDDGEEVGAKDATDEGTATITATTSISSTSSSESSEVSISKALRVSSAMGVLDSAGV
eukprot:g1773.t1